MLTVVETASFLRRAAEAGMTDLERFELVNLLAENPAMGDLIKGTGGVRKVRFARKGAGKSGGYRVITFYHSETLPVFLLTVYAKGAKVNLTQAERNGLAKLTTLLVDGYAQKVVALHDRVG